MRNIVILSLWSMATQLERSLRLRINQWWSCVKIIRMWSIFHWRKKFLKKHSNYFPCKFIRDQSLISYFLKERCPHVNLSLSNVSIIIEMKIYWIEVGISLQSSRKLRLCSFEYESVFDKKKAELPLERFVWL